MENSIKKRTSTSCLLLQSPISIVLDDSIFVAMASIDLTAVCNLVDVKLQNCFYSDHLILRFEPLMASQCGELPPC